MFRRYTVFSLLFFLLCCSIAQAGTINITPCSQDGINEALKEVYQEGGGTVYLNQGIYPVTGPIFIYENTKLIGDKEAIIHVDVTQNRWFSNEIGIINSVGVVNNVEICGFQVDGNCENLPFDWSHERSDTDHDCEAAIRLIGNSNEFMSNIKVHDMEIYDTFCDGITVRFCNYAELYSNFISNCEHEGIFCTCCIDSIVHGNKIAGITSDCERDDNCVRCKIYDNIFFSYNGTHANTYMHGENGVQIGDSGVSHGYDGRNKPTSTENIEVYNNTFADNGLKAILLDSEALVSSANVYVHDNKFIDATELKTMGIPVDISGSSLPSKDTSKHIFNSIFDFFTGKYSTQAGEGQTVILPAGVPDNPTEATCTIDYQTLGDNVTTLVEVPFDGLSQVVYEVNGIKETHTLMVGDQTTKGIEFSKTSIWEGELSHRGDALKLDGEVPDEQITVTCITPERTYTPNFVISKTKIQTVNIHPAIYTLILSLLIGFFIFSRIIKYSLF